MADGWAFSWPSEPNQAQHDQLVPVSHHVIYYIELKLHNRYKNYWNDQFLVVNFLFYSNKQWFTFIEGVEQSKIWDGKYTVLNIKYIYLYY